MRLFVGDDWAEAHHDVELMDASGRRLAKARLPEGVAGMTRLHAMIGEQLGEEAEEAEVIIGIETDRGPWVAALVAAGYTVYAVNPLQAARYRERLSVPHGLPPAAAGGRRQPASRGGQGRGPDAQDADLGTYPPYPTAAALAASALKRAGRRGDLAAKASPIQAALRTEQLSRPEVVTALHKEVEAHFGRHPAAEIICSQPGLGAVLGARVLAEFGDDPDRYTSAKARKNHAGTSPITRASGKKKVIAARFVHNDRLIDALITQAAAAIRFSPGARAYYDRQRARDADYNTALRQVANRLVGILHGCLKTGTLYDEATAWSSHPESVAA
ncbi:IS110 family transposase [Microbispora sp. NBC_01189]|uniref:IS110 family transposase n=1 Tax=Microbispora sp. NBC_01189 TaxID=2903583 RepID=UPI003A912390